MESKESVQSHTEGIPYLPLRELKISHDFPRWLFKKLLSPQIKLEEFWLEICFDMSPVFMLCSKNVRAIYREGSQHVKSVLISLTTGSSGESAALYDKICPASLLYKAEKLSKRSEKDRQNVHELKSGVHYKAIKLYSCVKHLIR